MMKKRHTKISLILLLLAVMLIASLTCVACASSAYAIKLDRTSVTLEKGESAELEYQLTKNGEADTQTEVVVSVKGDSVTYSKETNKITAVKAGKSELTLSVKGNSKTTAKLSVNVPLYEIEIKGNAVQKADLGGEDIIEYTVLKDGTKVTDKKVDVTVEGDALRYEKIGNRIYFAEVGTGKVKASLADDSAVYAEKTYNVTKSFWNSGDHQVNKDGMTITDNSVYIPGGSGSQYFLGVLEGGTKYVFRTKLTIPSPSALGTQTVGVTHDLDRNNAGLWFGINSPDGANGGKYRIYIKNFYGGWAGQDFVKYTNVEFSSDTVDVITVRDGSDFWFSIDGYCGTFTLPAAGDKNYISADTQTWAGIFSQERKLTATDFSYSTEEEAIAEAKTLCESPVAKFEITNSGVNKLVKGTSFTYSAKVIASNPANVPAVEWSLDKTAMTSGADGTTIADGTLSLAADAAGVVTVIANCGGKEVRIDVTVLSESIADENDVVKVDGGVVLGGDGSVTFTEEFNYNNANLNDTDFTEIYYSASLKNKVKGDFEFAFTLTDMKSASSPVFMVSLGNSLGNFFFTNNGVSVKTQYVDLNTKEYAEGTATATFAAADTLEVVIKVVGGHYKVTANGAELNFDGKDPVRRIEDYGEERSVLFTTGAGTSVKVSDITLTDKADADYIVLNNNARTTENGFVADIVTLGNGWDAKDKGVNKIFYAYALPAGDYTISMNVTFNTALSDGKLSINIGGNDFYVNNKLADGAVIGQWTNFSGETRTNITQPGKFKVELKKIGNDMYFFIGNTQVGDKFGVAGIGTTLSFWAANFAGSSDGATAEVSDLTVTNGATIIMLGGDNTVQVGASAVYSVTVLGGNEDDIVWALNKDGLTAGKDGTAFDAATRTLTFANDAAGTVVITATIGGVTAEITVAASSQPANQNTALAESVGGVKQDVANGKLIFDDAAANGVVSEDRYNENSTYYAILNTAANTRATIQDNFILEFTVSDYVTTAQYPKLMISLGGINEQFYIVYNREGHVNRIETYANSLSADKNNTFGGQWVSSADFAAGFDTTDSHKYKIICQNGFYKVELDGVELTEWKMNSDARILVRSPESMAEPCNIMFSTNSDTTATVSGVTLTQLGGDVTTHVSKHITVEKGADDKETVTLAFEKTVNWDNYTIAPRLYTYGSYGKNSVITFDVKFNANMADAKLAIKLTDSSRVVTLCTAGDFVHKSEICGEWGGVSIGAARDSVIKVTITVVNGQATVVFNDAYTVPGSAIDTNGKLSFCTFTETSGDTTGENKTVTISNISVTNS